MNPRTQQRRKVLEEIFGLWSEDKEYHLEQYAQAVWRAGLDAEEWDAVEWGAEMQRLASEVGMDVPTYERMILKLQIEFMHRHKLHMLEWDIHPNR